MKNFNLSLFLGCCVISIGIIIAGVIISNHLPPVLSGSFSGILTQDTPQDYSDYMSVYEASAFVQISTDKFIEFTQSGDLTGTFTTIQGEMVFSKDKLSQWLKTRIDQEAAYTRPT